MCCFALAYKNHDKKNCLQHRRRLGAVGFRGWAQALAVPVRRAAALSLKPVTFPIRLRYRDLRFATTLDGDAVIRFADHQGCLFGNVRYCSHIYGQPCTAPAVNYFFSTILLLHCSGFALHLSLLD